MLSEKRMNMFKRILLGEDASRSLCFSPIKCLLECAVIIAASAACSFGQDVGGTIPPRRACGAMPKYTAELKNPEFLAIRKQLFAFTAAFSSVSKNARTAPRTNLIRVPVVVHILYSNATENINDDQVKSQIGSLNMDYQNKNLDLNKVPATFRPHVGNPLIEFDLAAFDPAGNATTGITRTQTSVVTFFSDGPSGDNAKSSHTGGFDPWPADSYLNIWIVGSLKDKSSRSLLGYSSFPGEVSANDGVVIIGTAFGTTGTAVAPFNLGRTATHEIGHWLNLFHIWGDDENGPDVCAGSDQVDDTPNQALPNYACPAYPHDSCNNAADGGDMFMDFMDYTDDDCMQFFAQGQVIRMEATLAGFRANIAHSPGLPKLQ
jgi:hypothetical protein